MGRRYTLFSLNNVLTLLWILSYLFKLSYFISNDIFWFVNILFGFLSCGRWFHIALFAAPQKSTLLHLVIFLFLFLVLLKSFSMEWLPAPTTFSLEIVARFCFFFFFATFLNGNYGNINWFVFETVKTNKLVTNNSKIKGLNSISVFIEKKKFSFISLVYWTIYRLTVIYFHLNSISKQ